MTTKPLRVTWSSDEDIQTAILAGMGFSTKFITETTGLTKCQVSYRLHKAGIKRAAYRNGESDVAQRMLGFIPRTKQATRDLLNLKVIK